MLKKMLYVSDLDGTLLRDDSTLSDFARGNLTALLEAGAPFTLASARSVRAIKMVTGELPLTLPVVAFNGAFISDYSTGRPEAINALPPNVARDVLGLITEAGCAPFISSYDGEKDVIYYADAGNAGMRSYLDERMQWQDERLRHTHDLRHALCGDTVCLTVVDAPIVVSGLQARLETVLGDAVMCYRYRERLPGWAWLTVSDCRATKDRAIEAVLDSLGSRKEDLTVFGDDVNDIGMFKLAGNSVAVANATPELKMHATEIIGSNEDDAVVKYLLR